MSELTIQFKIVTPERTVFEDTVAQATLPVTDGQVTILPNHRSYIASLRSGEIMIKLASSANGKPGEEILLSTSGGFLEFAHNELVILADTAERAEEIDLKRAEEAKARAENLKSEAATAAAIQKHAARIQVARKHYTKKGISSIGNE